MPSCEYGNNLPSSCTVEISTTCKHLSAVQEVRRLTQHNKSTYLPTNAIRHITQLTHINTSTCFCTQVSSSGIYHKKGVYTSLIKIIVVKIHILLYILIKLVTMNKK